MKDNRTFEENMSHAEAATSALLRLMWASDQRKLLDQRRRIRSGQVEPQRPAGKVLPFARRTA